MRVFHAERKRIPKTEDSLADDAVLSEPLSGILAILAGKRGFLEKL
jgi:hypothetical protein